MFAFNGVTVNPKEQTRYLWVVLSIKLGYKNQLNIATVKACKTVNNLARIFSNVNGSKQQRRKLLTSVTQIQLLYIYAASNWAEAMVFRNNIRLIEGLQRRVALRKAMAHRTISTTAFQVKAGMITVHLLTLEWKRLYIKQNTDKKLNSIVEQKKMYCKCEEQ